jgi:hypothetical protein
MLFCRTPFRRQVSLSSLVFFFFLILVFPLIFPAFLVIGFYKGNLGGSEENSALKRADSERFFKAIIYHFSVKQAINGFQD